MAVVNKINALIQANPNAIIQLSVRDLAKLIALDGYNILNDESINGDYVNRTGFLEHQGQLARSNGQFWNWRFNRFRFQVKEYTGSDINYYHLGLYQAAANGTEDAIQNMSVAHNIVNAIRGLVDGDSNEFERELTQAERVQPFISIGFGFMNHLNTRWPSIDDYRVSQEEYEEAYDRAEALDGRR